MWKTPTSFFFSLELFWGHYCLWLIVKGFKQYDWYHFHLYVNLCCISIRSLKPWGMQNGWQNRIIEQWWLCLDLSSRNAPWYVSDVKERHYKDQMPSKIYYIFRKILLKHLKLLYQYSWFIVCILYCLLLIPTVLISSIHTYI